MAEANSAIAQILAQGPVVPVIVIDDAAHAMPATQKHAPERNTS